MYDTYHRRIAECDEELKTHLKSFADKLPPQEAGTGPASEEGLGKQALNGIKSKAEEWQQGVWQPTPIRPG